MSSKVTNQNNILIREFNRRESLFESVALQCKNRIRDSILVQKEASFIIPGGTTPSPVFELLSKSELPWEKVTIAQSDERWVDANHPQSNEKLTRTSLLKNNAQKANYISMKNNHSTSFSGESQTNEEYKMLTSPFTITMLGMGLDGHIASLFPGSKNIDEALSHSNKNLCIAIDAEGCPVAGDYPNRISLTLSAILNSSVIVLLITGMEKLNIIKNALKQKPSNDLPVSLILHQSNTPVEIFWSE